MHTGNGTSIFRAAVTGGSATSASHNIMSGASVNTTLNFIPNTTFVDIEIADNSPFGGTNSIQVFGFTIDTVTYIPQTVVATITSGDDYHYGFNGKYKDNEWAGLGNHIDYGPRNFDPRTARFTSVDPLSDKFPWYTPYQFAGNTPIQAIDLDGREEYHFTRTKDNSGRTTAIKPLKVVDIYKYVWDPKRTGTLTFTLWTRVKNPSKVYIVHETKRLPIPSQMRLKWQDYDCEATYNSANAAAHGKSEDFKYPDSYCLQVGIEAAADECREGNAPYAVRTSARGRIDPEGASSVAHYNRTASRELDCSDIAPSICREINGELLEITPASGKWMNGVEYGQKTEFVFHQVVEKDGYIYDPMFGSEPVPKADYMAAYNKMNPGGLKVEKK